MFAQCGGMAGLLSLAGHMPHTAFVWGSLGVLPVLDSTPSRHTPQQTSPPSPLPLQGGRRGGPKGPERVRMYQIAAPSLVLRTKVFGCKLALKGEWVCSDQPYFAAPGARARAVVGQQERGVREGGMGFCCGPSGGGREGGRRARFGSPVLPYYAPLGEQADMLAPAFRL